MDIYFFTSDLCLLINNFTNEVDYHNNAHFKNKINSTLVLRHLKFLNRKLECRTSGGFKVSFLSFFLFS